MGTEPHQGVGGGDLPHVRVVEGVRPVAGLDHLLDANHAVREQNVHRVQATVVELVVRLGDRHILIISYSSVILHERFKLL